MPRKRGRDSSLCAISVSLGNTTTKEQCNGILAWLPHRFCQLIADDPPEPKSIPALLEFIMVPKSKL